METYTISEIRLALKEKSFKTNLGNGVRVVYPNEVLMELLGKGEEFDKQYIDEDE